MKNARDNEVVETGRYKYRYFSAAQTAYGALLAIGDGVIHSVTVSGGTAGDVFIGDTTEDNLVYNQLNLLNTNALKTYILDMNYKVKLLLLSSAATKVTVCFTSNTDVPLTFLNSSDVTGGVITIYAQFSEEVTGFDATGVIVTNATVTSVTPQTTNQYVIVVTADAGTSVPVSVQVPAGKATGPNGKLNTASNVLNYTITS